MHRKSFQRISPKHVEGDVNMSLGKKESKERRMNIDYLFFNIFLNCLRFLKDVYIF